MDWATLTRQVVEVGLFSALGLGVFASAFWVMGKCAPFSVKKEIAEDQNTALGIVMASVIVGIAIIVAAALKG